MKNFRYSTLCLFSFFSLLSSLGCQLNGLNNQFNNNIDNVISYQASNTYIADLENQCYKGDSKQCFKAGEIYYWGKNVLMDKKRGKKLWLQGCKKGNGASCLWAGIAFYKEKKDIQNAITLFKKACDRNESFGCIAEGLIFVKLKNKEQRKNNITLIASWFTKGCKMQNPVSCYLEKKVLEHNLSFFLKLKDKKNKTGKDYLIIGTLYLLGISLNWNPSKGINSFFKGCYHFKNGDSCFILGKIYSKGIWVNENYWKVLKFFRWGCKFHSNFACKELP